MLVLPVVLHDDGVTEASMGGCSSRDASKSVDAAPTPVDTTTSPRLSVVMHSTWLWACGRGSGVGVGVGVGVGWGGVGKEATRAKVPHNTTKQSHAHLHATH